MWMPAARIPVAPYTSWATAATNIQDAMDATGVGDIVLVTNGIYQYGGASWSGSNRVHVINGVSLQSVNGPAVTVIKGYWDPATTNGPNAVRCVYLTEFSSLSGFTLTNGASGSGYGGGVVSESSCVISNCVITGNASAGNGAGSESINNSLLVNCVLSGNIAMSGGAGGGAYGSTLVNCIVSNNYAPNGGGVVNCTVYDSLLTGNGSTNSGVTGTSGGAAYSSTLYNCTLAGNFSRTLGAADGLHAHQQHHLLQRQRDLRRLLHVPPDQLLHYAGTRQSHPAEQLHQQRARLCEPGRRRFSSDPVVQLH